MNPLAKLESLAQWQAISYEEIQKQGHETDERLGSPPLSRKNNDG